MIDRDTARRRFEAFLDAMETYEGANSDEARAAAEDKVLAARAALDGETGAPAPKAYGRGIPRPLRSGHRPARSG
jgi:hypothetical protein